MFVKESKYQFQNYGISGLADLNTIISHIANHDNYQTKVFILIIDNSNNNNTPKI
ncbi:MAG: hypothetical protein HFH67_14390 [Lachnospiraceae bacterium]|nr:hypothetical protein [Lachnospiraceae bacterium]